MADNAVVGRVMTIDTLDGGAPGLTAAPVNASLAAKRARVRFETTNSSGPLEFREELHNMSPPPPFPQLLSLAVADQQLPHRTSAAAAVDRTRRQR